MRNLTVRASMLALAGLAISLALHATLGYSHLAVLLVALMAAAWLFGVSAELLLASAATIAVQLLATHDAALLDGLQGDIDVLALLLGMALLAWLSRNTGAALEEAQALNSTLSSELQARTGIWSGAAHDLKHPLAAINLRAEILQRRLDRPVRRDELLEGIAEIRSTAHEMRELIEEMQDAAKLEDGLDIELTLESMDLVALAADFSDKACSRTGRAIRVEATSGEVWGRWDRARIGRVLANLLSNALKYSPPDSEVRVCAGQDSDWAVLAVSDRGAGIPEAELEHVFDRFYRGANVKRRVYGTGLGLAGSLTIVEQHGGSISVESVEGAGSTFTVRLPLSPAPAGEPRLSADELLAVITAGGLVEPEAARPRTYARPPL